MNLARNKNGSIGRQIPGQGIQARTVPSRLGEAHGNLYLSAASIAREQADRAKKEYIQSEAIKKNKIAQAQKRRAERLQAQKGNQRIGASQAAAKYNPMNAKLAMHFAKQKTMGQDEMVATSLYHAPNWTRGTTGKVFTPRPPADFSNSGANMDTVPSNQPVEPVIWHTDFRMHMIKGNPLTRNGSYGPGVTDFDRFVNGRDVNDQAIDGGGDGTERLAGSERIAGGTMLGRLHGSQVRAGIANRGRNSHLGDEFDDFESDDSGGFFSDLWTSAQDTVSSALPGALASQITGGGGSPSSPGSTVTVIRPPTTIASTATMVPGVPNWALYSGIGLMGVGVLFAVLNAIKK